MDSFLLNGGRIYIGQLREKEFDSSHFSTFENEVIAFIKAWLSDQKSFSIKTSGTTGNPKTITFPREQLIRSAKRTLKFFKLEPGNKALMCLSPKFVAGMMMLVRAIEGNLNLTVATPSSNPLNSIPADETIDFGAFTPNQIESMLKSSPERMIKIKNILIGGAGLHSKLEKELQNIQSDVFHSYATTETLSHVALRKVNGRSKAISFTALGRVSFKTDNRSCLIINDGLLGIKDLVTNDMVELLNDKGFIWKGRYDHIINSGGIKIHVEKVENEIQQILLEVGLKHRFCVVSQEDPKLTEKLILLIEKGNNRIDELALLATFKEKMPKYHAPKKIIEVREIFHTNSGKIDRISNMSRYIKNMND